MEVGKAAVEVYCWFGVGRGYWGRKNAVDSCGYYWGSLFIKIECIRLFFDVSMVMV